MSRTMLTATSDCVLRLYVYSHVDGNELMLKVYYATAEIWNNIYNSEGRCNNLRRSYQLSMTICCYLCELNRDNKDKY